MPDNSRRNGLRKDCDSAIGQRRDEFEPIKSLPKFAECQSCQARAQAPMEVWCEGRSGEDVQRERLQGRTRIVNVDDVTCHALVDVVHSGVCPMVVVAIAVVQTQTLHAVQLHAREWHWPRHIHQSVDRGSGEASHAGVVKVVVGTEDVRGFPVDLARHREDGGILEHGELRCATHW